MLIQYFKNAKKNKSSYPEELKSVLNKEDCKSAYEEIKTWDNYSPTPLLSLENIATEIGLKDIYFKNESGRFGLGSFKALGGTYGVLKFIHNQLKQEIGNEVTFDKIKNGDYKNLISKYTVTTATDGNHGRAIAFGAKIFGCKCQIFVHSQVSNGRQEAMEKLGANVVRILGNYDESLNVCKKEAFKNNWHIISDTSYEGYTKYPKYIMAGYTVMAQELDKQFKNKLIPTHVFLQAGVGSFPASICSYLWQKYNSNMKIIIVESELAPCLIKSAKNNKMVSHNIIEETIMAGLSCGEPSLLGWQILDQSVDHFITINDELIPKTMKLLFKNKPQIEAGESSVAGLAGLLDLMKKEDIIKSTGLNKESIVLLFGTEGATDPDIFRSIIES